MQNRIKQSFNIKRLNKMIKASSGDTKIPAVKKIMNDKKATRSLAYRLLKED